jgi:hypothetical protein
LQEGADGEALLVMPEVSHLAASRDRIHAFESVRVMTTLAEDVDVDVSTDPDDDVDPDARLLQDDDGDESTQDATEAAP